MSQTDVMPAATLACRGDPQGLGRSWIPAVGKILAQRGLNYRRQWRTGFLRFPISLDSLFQIVRYGYGYPLHISPLAPLGAADEASLRWF